MKEISLEMAKSELEAIVQHVQEDTTPVMITSEGQPPAVLLSLKEYMALRELLYITQTPQRVKTGVNEDPLHPHLEKMLLEYM